MVHDSGESWVVPSLYVRVYRSVASVCVITLSSLTVCEGVSARWLFIITPSLVPSLYVRVYRVDL